MGRGAKDAWSGAQARRTIIMNTAMEESVGMLAMFVELKLY